MTRRGNVLRDEEASTPRNAAFRDQGMLDIREYLITVNYHWCEGRKIGYVW
jgi:hypothetical protein